MATASCALVTGASSGIGEAFCRALHARGYRLILVARRADRLSALSQSLGGEERAAVIPLDLTAAGAASRLHAEVARRGLAVDLLINNAGFGDAGRFHEQPVERALGMIDLNARVLVETTRLFLPEMVARKRGAVINVASTAAFQPVSYLAIYAATKAFVLSFTEGIAVELDGTGVSVQALCPGLTATEFQQVAGTERVLFNRTLAMSPDEVVAISLKGLDRGRLTVIAGWPNRATAFLQRFLPRALVRRVAATLFRPH